MNVIICKKTIDNCFIMNKEYIIDDGFLYTEQDVSINTKPYNSIEEAINDLSNKGYVFVSKNSYGTQSDAFGFSPENIFGDIFSMYGNVNTQTSDSKRAEAEDLKNSILKNILNL